MLERFGGQAAVGAAERGGGGRRRRRPDAGRLVGAGRRTPSAGRAAVGVQRRVVVRRRPHAHQPPFAVRGARVGRAETRRRRRSADAAVVVMVVVVVVVVGAAGRSVLRVVPEDVK